MIKKRTTKVALFTDLFGEKGANCRFGLIDKVLGSYLYLQSSNPGTHEYEWKIHARFMNIRREKFLHADGRTPSTDIAGKWKKVFHRDEVALLVARYLGGHLQVHFMFAGDDAYKIA